MIDMLQNVEQSFFNFPIVSFKLLNDYYYMFSNYVRFAAEPLNFALPFAR